MPPAQQQHDQMSDQQPGCNVQRVLRLLLLLLLLLRVGHPGL